MATISCIAGCVPAQAVPNSYFQAWHDEEAVQTAADLVGVETRYWAPSDVSTLDLCVAAGQALLGNAPLAEGVSGPLVDHIELLIFVTQTPHVMMPGMAYAAHQALGLPDSCACLSVNAGCSGYVENIALACDLLEGRDGKYALVLVGDVLSQKLDPTDRSTALVFGDAGTATLVDNVSPAAKSARRVYVSGSRSSGRGAIHLCLPQADVSPTLYMHGMDVFNFTISQIPVFIKSVRSAWRDKYGIAADEDYFLLHQANRMILKHVMKKMKLPAEKMPINIQNFGNTSGATIPLLMLDMLKEGICFENSQVLMTGFGVGLGWAAMISDMAKIHSAGIISYER